MKNTEVKKVNVKQLKTNKMESNTNNENLVNNNTELRKLIQKHGWNEINKNLKLLKEVEPKYNNKRKLENLKNEFIYLCEGSILKGESTISKWKSEEFRINGVIDDIWGEGFKIPSKSDKKKMEILNDELDSIKNRIDMEQHSIDCLNNEIEEKKYFKGNLDMFLKKYWVQLGKFRSGWSFVKKDLFPFGEPTSVEEILTEFEKNNERETN